MCCNAAQDARGVFGKGEGDNGELLLKVYTEFFAGASTLERTLEIIEFGLVCLLAGLPIFIVYTTDRAPRMSHDRSPARWMRISRTSLLVWLANWSTGIAC